MYPAVKEYLLSFGYDRLKQTGEKGSRKKTNNEWFETQDSISYWEDFFRPKIMYQEMVQVSSFLLDENEKYFCLDTGRIIIGKNLKFLLSIFNSNLFFFSIKYFYGGGGLGTKGIRMKHTFFEKYAIPQISEDIQKSFVNIINEILNLKNKNHKITKLEHELNQKIYKLYELTEEEIEYIENHC